MIAARIGIQAAIIVFAVARDIQPEAAPALAIMRRSEQAVHNFGERVGRRVLFESRDLFGRRRQAGQIERGAADQIVLGGRSHRLDAFLFQMREDEAVDIGLRPFGSLTAGGAGSLSGRKDQKARRSGEITYFSPALAGAAVPRPRRACRAKRRRL